MDPLTMFLAEITISTIATERARAEADLIRARCEQERTAQSSEAFGFLYGLARGAMGAASAMITGQKCDIPDCPFCAVADAPQEETAPTGDVTPD